MTTLDAPSAVAASICWLARWRGQGAAFARVADRHPRECGWCVYPPEYLIAMVEDFNDADLVYDGHGGLKVDFEGQPVHRIGGNFHRLPKDQQRSLVDAALYAPVPA